MMAPTAMLWLYALAQDIASALAPAAESIEKRAEVAASVALPLVVSSWVMADARKRG